MSLTETILPKVSGNNEMGKVIDTISIDALKKRSNSAVDLWEYYTYSNNTREGKQQYMH